MERKCKMEHERENRALSFNAKNRPSAISAGFTRSKRPNFTVAQRISNKYVQYKGVFLAVWWARERDRQALQQREQIAMRYYQTQHRCSIAHHHRILNCCI
jgi:hypothetical protein